MTTKVLLVEDHRLVREALRQALALQPDMEVVGEAGDGATALESVERLQPDVVILDIALPGLNGIEVASRLKDRVPGTRIIGLSGYRDKRFVVEMLRAGAQGYVTKVSAGTELVRAIRAVSRGETYLCPDVADPVVSGLREASEQKEPQKLGRREREVLRLIAQGFRSNAIARELHISVGTVEVHRRNITRKLGLRGVAELTRYAVREGIAPP